MNWENKAKKFSGLNISNENLEMVGDFFMKLKDYFEKIFVISHNPLISNWADNIVKITKTDNISKVSQ